MEDRKRQQRATVGMQDAKIEVLGDGWGGGGGAVLKRFEKKILCANL